MAKSKFFRVAVEGVTTDGREITRDWIQQMAATYNPAKYGARIFAEHIRGMSPDGPFRALGDVSALKAEEITEGDLKGRLALFAQIDPSDVMVKLIKSGQKIYSSIEVDPSFADSKLAYLTGLGITDSPASLGTEVLAFAAQHPDASPFQGRKHRAENLFTAAAETSIELEDEAAAADDPATAGFFTKLTEILDKFSGKTKPAPAPDPIITSTAPTDVAEFAAAFRTGLADMTEQFTKLSKEVAELPAQITAARTEFDNKLSTLRTELDNAPASHNRRPPATGGNGAVVTDC